MERHPSARKRVSRLGRAWAAAWLALAGAHLVQGAIRYTELLGVHDRVPVSPTATSDRWLDDARTGVTSRRVSRVLAGLPEGQPVILVAPAAKRSVPPWPFVSYLAWPRRVWSLECEGSAPRPGPWPRRPERVPWLVYAGLDPPERLTRIARAGRLTLAAANPNVPWTSYCSP